MESVHPLGSNFDYWKQLAGAASDGIGSARREIDDKVFARPVPPALWALAAVGGVIGILGGRTAGNRKRSAKTAVGGLVGAALGFSAGLAWASAPVLRPVARTSARRINAIRDARWLAIHPIDYA